MTKIGMVRQVGAPCFSGVTTPPSQRAGPSVPKIFWDQRPKNLGTSYLCPYGLTYSDRIWCDNTIGIGACFQVVSHASIPRDPIYAQTFDLVRPNLVW